MFIMCRHPDTGESQFYESKEDLIEDLNQILTDFGMFEINNLEIYEVTKRVIPNIKQTVEIGF